LFKFSIISCLQNAFLFFFFFDGQESNSQPRDEHCIKRPHPITTRLGNQLPGLFLYRFDTKTKINIDMETTILKPESLKHQKKWKSDPNYTKSWYDRGINGGMEPPEEPPAVNFAFVSSVLLPDGTPDVHFRVACGGQKLRDIMLDSNIELYGPYVVEGKELLNPRTDKEKEKLKRVFNRSFAVI
ncbi:hypothetical protein HYC85_005046, partial [Camellia sinensis]